jgi:hypothetical protein
MAKWIGYRIGYDNEGTPISTGATREEAQLKAIRRVLSIADVHSQIGTQEKPELSDEDFEAVTKIVDEWATKHCGIAA